MEGEHAYEHLWEVYRALRLMVNYVQPSFKLQEILPRGDREHRVYDLAQTPLQRLLASGVLSEERKRALSALVDRLDPLVLSEQLDILRYALLWTAQAASEEEMEWTEDVVALTRPSGPRAMPPHALIPTGVLAREPRSIDQLERPDEAHVVGKHALPVLEQAIAAYLQELRVSERRPQTLQWHQTSLRALRNAVWRQFHLIGKGELSRELLQAGSQPFLKSQQRRRE